VETLDLSRQKRVRGRLLRLRKTCLGQELSIDDATRLHPKRSFPIMPTVGDRSSA